MTTRSERNESGPRRVRTKDTVHEKEEHGEKVATGF